MVQVEMMAIGMEILRKAILPQQIVITRVGPLQKVIKVKNAQNLEQDLI